MLIVCEGSKTEPQYFKDIKSLRRLSSAQIDVVGGDRCGSNPINIVQYAIEHGLQDRINYDEIWCVFDRDSHLHVHDAFAMAEAKGINIAFSDPSFEIWFYLHFVDHRAFIQRDRLLHELKQYIPNYDKTTKGLYEQIEVNRSTAERRARFLKDMHIGNGNEARHNPSTEAYLVVNALISL